MTYDYDPEVPAGYQEADLLQAQYEAEAARYRRLQEQGICVHGSWVGKNHDGNGPLPSGDYYPEQVDLLPGQVRCTAGCGQVFDSDEAIHRAHVEAGR